MKWKRSKCVRIIASILACFLILSGCQSTNTNNGQESSAISEDGYVIEAFVPETLENDVYYWVFLQNGRIVMSQEDVEKINERLQKEKIEASIVFYIVTIEEYAGTYWRRCAPRVFCI